MNTRPQECLPYLELARQEARITRQIGLCELPRLETLVVDGIVAESDAALTVDLRFGRTPEGLVRVQGSIRGTVGLTCQRCIQGLPHRLDIELDDLIVESESMASRVDAVAGAVGCDQALIVANGTEISVPEIVEDEILLGLPEWLCTEEPCERVPGLAYPADTGASGAGDDGAAESPFRVLSDLIGNDRRSSE
ncbi:MAG: YceD family protein [Pseudomonadales bacterium]